MVQLYFTGHADAMNGADMFTVIVGKWGFLDVFFFQAEDGIRDLTVTGVQTCALPIFVGHSFGGLFTQMIAGRGLSAASVAIDPGPFRGILVLPIRSEERRVGEECRSRWSPYH